MYFIEFPVSATNMFPLTNSTTGAQNLTEYNMRSRETVATDPSVKYPIGPSYTHSLDDFEIKSSAEGADIPSTAIQIQPGRALVNGHYVELLTPIVIDLAAVNYKASKEGVNILKGPLAIGLVMMYSNYTTLAGSALVENDEGYFEGIRVVIVPETEMRRPIEVPDSTQYTEVNMHLLLGKFLFYGGVVSNVSQNEDKMKIFDASRIGDISSSLSDMYVSKAGLDESHFYVFASRGNDETANWCKAEESLMIWDTNPTLDKNNPHSAIVAHFEYNYDSEDKYGETSLVVPHKQIDGAKDQQGNRVYFADKRYAIPNATFNPNSGGVVNPAYTQRILHIEDMTNHFYRLPNGRMRKYLDVLDADRADLPPIPVGDGSAEPIDVSEVFADVQSALTAASQALGPRNTSGTAANLLNTAMESLLSQAPKFDYPILSGVQEVASHLGSTGSFTSAINDVINMIGSSRYSQAIAALRSLTTDSDGFPGSYNLLQQSISGINQVKSVEGSGGSVYTILDNAMSKIMFAMDKIDLSSYLLTTVTTAIETYIQTEVNKRADAITVLTSSVWSPGDYVLVGRDMSMAATSSGVYPSTLYVVDYGQVLTIRYVDVLQKTINSHDLDYENKLDLVMHTVLPSLAGGVELASVKLTDDPQGPPPLSTFKYTEYKGAVGTDYFVARYCTDRDSEGNETWYSYFYTPSSTNQQLTYIDPPIQITGGVPLATTESIGGFLNVPDTDELLGQGYVALDENGHLRILDYNYLAYGIEAQQLGQDLSIGSGLDAEAIQDNLNEYVNDRICYPNNTQRQNKAATGEDPHIIILELTLPSTTDPAKIEIRDIGSRSDSYLYVKLLGNPTSAITVSFENCEKLRIDETIPGGVNIVLKNVNLYYNSNVLDRAGSNSETGIQSLKLWYTKYKNTDPDLEVDGMTVTLLSNIENNETLDPWHENGLANDNHYTYALRSLTFANDGTIIGAGMLVGNQSTSNVDPEGTSIFRASFTLPQSSGLSYPATKMTHQLKITGSFISCYWAESPISKYVVMDTNFSALTQKYVQSSGQTAIGSIAFYTVSSLQDHVIGVADGTTIDCWDLHKPHIFYGGAIE